jgi:hypothetical protein
MDFDRSQVESGTHMIYAGYGYSGSGKTYTLVNLANKNSILNKIIKLHGITDLSFEFIDLYGEIKDEGCITENKKIDETPKMTTTTYTSDNSEVIVENFNEHKGFSFNKVIELENFMSNLEDVRKNASLYRKFHTEFQTENTPERARIRETPNNSNSSRAHLFINIYIAKALNTTQERHDRPLYTIVDMGGSEDVDEIQKLYYTSETSYNYKEFVSKLQTQMINLKDLNTSKIKKMTFVDLTTKEKKYYHSTYYTKLIYTTNIEYEDQNDYSYDRFSTNWQEILYKTEYDFIQPVILENINAYYILGEMNVILSELSNYNLKKKILAAKTFNDLVSFVNERFANIKAANINIITNKGGFKKTEINIATNNIIEIQNKLISADLLTLLTEIGKNSKFNTIIDQYEEYVNSIKKKYHCPLRYQGNFINESIKSFETIANDIQKNKSNDGDNIKDEIKDIIQIEDKNIKNKKLVIFTCIREDKPDSITPSLKFAHCINPLRNTAYFDCSNVSAGKILQTGGNIFFGGNTDFIDKSSIVSALQNIAVYNIIKALRYNYYKKQETHNGHDDSETIIFKDYLFTTILCVTLYATKREKLAMGVFLDQVVSMILYYKYRDDKVLLLPYYVPFI